MTGAKSTKKKNYLKKVSKKVRKTSSLRNSKLCEGLKSKRRKLKEDPIIEIEEKSICDNSLSQDEEFSSAPGDSCSQSLELEIADSEEPALPYDCAVFPLDKNYKSSLLAMKISSKGVKIHGWAKLEVLSGSCSLNGFVLNAGDPPKLVSAPLTHVALAMCPVNAGTTESKSHTSAKYADVLPEIEKILNSYEIVVLFQSQSNQTTQYPGYPDIFIVKTPEVNDCIMICKHCYLCSTERYFIENKPYISSAEALLAYSKDNNCGGFPVVVSVGGKNVGKSTFNRYLVNRLLSSHSHVYYFDCDIGQSEFTPSGFLSVTRVDQDHPLINPTFANQIKPLLTCYFGHNTPSGDPDYYSSCVQFLFQSLFETLRGNLDGPLVVNTMGWVRALGLQLLIDTIRMVNPTHIVQFQVPRESRNTAQLTTELVSSTTGWLTSPSRAQHELLTMEIATNTPEIIKYMAPDYRNLSMLSKLLEIADACFSRDNKTTVNMCRKSLLGKLQKAKPYKIPLKQLQLYNATDSPVKYKHAFAALNASVVALCKTEQPDPQNLQADDIIPPPHPCQCVGVGLVRGIDHDNGVIYVLSDLSLDQLLTVNCIIRGNSAVPEPLMLEQGKMDSSGGSLYVTKNFPYETVGAGMFKVHRKFSKLTRDGK